jgi:hypothetical protein
MSRKYYLRYASETAVIAAASPYACISINFIFVSSIKSSEQHAEIIVRTFSAFLLHVPSSQKGRTITVWGDVILRSAVRVLMQRSISVLNLVHSVFRTGPAFNAHTKANRMSPRAPHRLCAAVLTARPLEMLKQRDHPDGQAP